MWQYHYRSYPRADSMSPTIEKTIELCSPVPRVHCIALTMEVIHSAKVAFSIYATHTKLVSDTGVAW